MNYATIKPTGLLDSDSANQMRLSVADAIADGASVVVVDFVDVTFMNSSAIGALVSTLRETKAQQKELYLCSLNPQLKMIFELTRMEDIFQIYSDLDTFEQQYKSVCSTNA